MTKVEQFNEFVMTRFQVGDWSDFLSADRSRLSRRKILEACLFSRSTLYQNGAFRTRLAEIEGELQCIGILEKPDAERRISLDDESLLVAIDEMEQRLDTLCSRMDALSSSIEGARDVVCKLGTE